MVIFGDKTVCAHCKNEFKNIQALRAHLKGCKKYKKVKEKNLEGLKRKIRKEVKRELLDKMPEKRVNEFLSTIKPTTLQEAILIKAISVGNPEVLKEYSKHIMASYGVKEDATTKELRSEIDSLKVELGVLKKYVAEHEAKFQVGHKEPQQPAISIKELAEMKKIVESVSSKTEALSKSDANAIGKGLVDSIKLLKGK